MKFLRCVGLSVLMVSLFKISFAQPAKSEECKLFNVVFNETVTVVPSGVYAGQQRIGTAQLAEKGIAGFKGLSVCIDNKHSGAMDENTICYLSGDKLIVYNVWATGVDLREGDNLKGFPNRSSVYMYEANMLFQEVVNFSVSFVRDQLGKLLGEKTEHSKNI